jgi:hypothetical protein
LTVALEIIILMRPDPWFMFPAILRMFKIIKGLRPEFAAQDNYITFRKKIWLWAVTRLKQGSKK